MSSTMRFRGKITGGPAVHEIMFSLFCHRAGTFGNHPIDLRVSIRRLSGAAEDVSIHCVRRRSSTDWEFEGYARSLFGWGYELGSGGFRVHCNYSTATREGRIDVFMDPHEAVRIGLTTDEHITAVTERLLARKIQRRTQRHGQPVAR